MSTAAPEGPAPRVMHAAEREKLILSFLDGQGMVAFRELERRMQTPPATLRRDLDRLAKTGAITRVRGGAKLERAPTYDHHSLAPVHQRMTEYAEQKRAIGRKAASLCQPGEALMIDGGSTTLQMCAHLDGLNLQVLTNSLYIVSALLPQEGTRVLVPGGTMFREQNIILAPMGEDTMPLFHAPRLFMGVAAVGAAGLMQADTLLVAAQRRFIERAEQVIVLVDSSKFTGSSGAVVCSLDKITTIVTDAGISDAHAQMFERAGIELLIAGE